MTNKAYCGTTTLDLRRRTKQRDNGLVYSDKQNDCRRNDKGIVAAEIPSVLRHDGNGIRPGPGAEDSGIIAVSGSVANIRQHALALRDCTDQVIQIVLWDISNIPIYHISDFFLASPLASKAITVLC